VQFELTVPTIRDRVVQTAAKLVLEPIFEADLEDARTAIGPAAAGSTPSRK
jgi:RNA-directed DNA polymerase